ncbi:sporulation protein YpjB [Paenibacillus sp.]|uniref:sporulation protein YpjB n=1 Tax=Paenibacillus sp. TaxID=58172 RepID=UPI002D4777B6|nr:sporulation protein YpjB [Paenibacillus sp.]HZG85267.1 sporulation protein YpjB [Paenibacillus sp.]
MVFTRRIRRGALLCLGAAILAFASGCGSEAPRPETESNSKKVITDLQRQTMRQMDEAAESAFQSAQRGDLSETKTRVAQLSVLSTKLSYDGLTTVEGVEAVTGSITGAMQALNSVSPDKGAVVTKVASVRLAVDALAHRQQPMWLEYRAPLEETLDRMASAVEAKDDPQASEALAAWRVRIAVVRPAIVVSRDAAEAVKLDSITAFLTNGLRSADWDGLAQAMPSLKSALVEVFAGEDRETVSPLLPTAEPPHPILWSFGLGSFIVAVLGYVAWRKYTGEQGVARVKTERDFEGRW